MTDWHLQQDLAENAWLLTDGKRKVWFTVSTALAELKVLMWRTDTTPLEKLTLLVQADLKPYKTEGDFDAITFQGPTDD